MDGWWWGRGEQARLSTQNAQGFGMGWIQQTMKACNEWEMNTQRIKRLGVVRFRSESGELPHCMAAAPAPSPATPPAAGHSHHPFAGAAAAATAASRVRW